jgi:Cu(I)/Ag(I) efflux system protein CusF
MKAIHMVAAASLVIPFVAQAQTGPAPANEHASHHPPAASAAATPTAMTEGEVRKVDRERGKLTLRHGPISNLEMSGMTMVFRVADPKMLDAVREGDKVKFAADKVNGALTVTAIEVAK